jgi:hypothetical protein
LYKNDKKVMIKTEFLIEMAKEQPRFHFNVVEDFFNYIEVEDIERNEKGILTFVYYGIKKLQKRYNPQRVLTGSFFITKKRGNIWILKT